MNKVVAKNAYYDIPFDVILVNYELQQINCIDSHYNAFTVMFDKMNQDVITSCGKLSEKAKRILRSYFDFNGNLIKIDISKVLEIPDIYSTYKQPVDFEYESDDEDFFLRIHIRFWDWKNDAIDCVVVDNNGVKEGTIDSSSLTDLIKKYHLDDAMFSDKIEMPIGKWEGGKVYEKTKQIHI